MMKMKLQKYKLSAFIQYRDTYDQLPEAQRDSYRFLGWYTLKDKGVLVTSDIVFLLTKDQTLYAHWEKSIFLETSTKTAKSPSPTSSHSKNISFSAPISPPNNPPLPTSTQTASSTSST